MKRLRRNRTPWYQPAPLPPVAVFRCRRCLASLTQPLQVLTDPAKLSQKECTSLVPSGHYWLVTEDHDFAGQLAVPLDALVSVGYHADRARLLGCCGPSGTGGLNRVCGCGREVGTERSDCIWPHAAYLDPARVEGIAPGGLSCG
jgi:hypothetical protein